MATLYLVTEAPTEIVCPPWCQVTAEEHRAELAQAWNHEGDCFHERRVDMSRRGSHDSDLILCAVTAADGRPRAGDERELTILGESMSLAEAERAAQAILDAVKLARGA